MKNLLLVSALCGASLGAVCTSAHPSTISVSFADPGGSYSAYYADITRTVMAAGQDWLAHFATSSSASLEVQIGFDAAAGTAQGASATSSYIGTNASNVTVWEQGAAYELNSGLDPNGSAPDILFTIGTAGYLQSDLWFDGQLGTGAPAAVPTGLTDAYSVFAHEFGHALGFNGWRDDFTGALPGSFESNFDALVASDGAGGLVFVGSHAVALYGAPVPLAWGNYGHLGAVSMAGDGSLDLMNGMGFATGTRYTISALDVAIMADLGMTTLAPLSPAPEPAEWALMLAGLAGIGVLTRRRVSGSRARG